MDYSLFFNHLSLPASGKDEAYSLLINSFQGVLRLNQNEDRFILYFDVDYPDDCILSEDFTYGNFKKNLYDNGENDLLTFIYEIEDKTPVIERLLEEDIDVLSQRLPYFEDRPYPDKNLDIFNIAWFEDGIMLSLATEELWQKHTITFASLLNGQHQPDECTVYNISKKEHANFILKDMEPGLQDICPGVIFDANFINWYDECKKEDKNRVKSRLLRCYSKNFKLVRPIIDTLSGSRFPNMKEIRFGNAYAQSGKIRILFAMSPDRKTIILHGFIKHSNKDYPSNIRIADTIFSRYQV